MKRIKSSDRNDNDLYNEKYQAHIPSSFAYKVVCVDNKFIKPVVLYREKMQFIDLLKQFLGSVIIARE